MLAYITFCQSTIDLKHWGSECRRNSIDRHPIFKCDAATSLKQWGPGITVQVITATLLLAVGHDWGIISVLPIKLVHSTGWYISLRWRHNGRDGDSNHQPHDCLLNRLFRRRSKKYQSSASLAFVRGIHRGPVNSPHKWPVTRKCFHFMTSLCFCVLWNIKYFCMAIQGNCLV